MVSPFSAYDPLFLSHWAFMDHLWTEWQKKNPHGRKMLYTRVIFRFFNNVSSSGISDWCVEKFGGTKVYATLAPFYAILYVWWYKSLCYIGPL